MPLPRLKFYLLQGSIHMKPGLIRRWRVVPRATLGQRLRQLAMAVGLATVLNPLTLAAPVRPADIQRGEYLARLGDCVACHTAERGQPMAGGRALKTPFGKLYSTNITPDRETGIGGYSLA